MRAAGLKLLFLQTPRMEAQPRVKQSPKMEAQPHRTLSQTPNVEEDTLILGWGRLWLNDEMMDKLSACWKIL